MASKKKALRIHYPEEQRYACRDCPARCCRTPWGIPVSPEVAHAALSDSGLRERLVGRAPAILAGGTLPMVERDRQLQCVFLDDDLLCGLQKRFGHSGIPQACQAYPFGFMKNEQGEPVALLSRHCPSIRDNYGELLSGQIASKLEQAGGARPLASRMGLRSGRTLALKQYLMVVGAWREILAAGSPLRGALQSYALTDEFDDALPRGAEPKDLEVQQAIEVARERTVLASQERRTRPTWQARVFYAHVLGSLSYPARVLPEFAARRSSFSQRLGAWGNKLSWLLQVGKVDLLYVPSPVAMAQIDRVPPFLAGELAPLVADYLSEVIARGQLFARQTYLTRVIVDLGLTLCVVSRFARASAVGHGRKEVAKADVLEALGVADLVMAHRGEGHQDTVLENLRLSLMSDPKAFRRFLASEVP